MFNTTNYESKVINVSKETVIEKSIGPDKVTDMYDKIKKEVEDSLVSKVIISSTFYEATIMSCYDCELGAIRVKICFKINGREIIKDKILGREKSNEEMFEMTNELFREVLQETFSENVLESIYRINQKEFNRSLSRYSKNPV